MQEPTIDESAFEIEKLFPTVMIKYRWPDWREFNAELLRELLKRRESDPTGKTVTNRGQQWQSQNNLETWPEPCFQELMRRFEALVCYGLKSQDEPVPENLAPHTLEAWAQIGTKGGYNVSHTHDAPGGSNVWSMVYYVDPGSDDSSYNVFHDVSGMPIRIDEEGANLYRREYRLKPLPGLMSLFSAQFPHYVEVYHGDTPRVLVGCNVRHPSYAIPFYKIEGKSEPDTWMRRNFRGVVRAKERLADVLGIGPAAAEAEAEAEIRDPKPRSEY